MFKLNEIYELDRRLLKCDFERFSPSETCITITRNSQMYMNLPREITGISLLNSYLEFIFEVIEEKLMIPDMQTVMI